MWSIHAVGYCSVFKKKENLQYSVYITHSLEDIILGEINQIQKDIHCLIPLLRSPIAQMVKNPSATRETWVRSLGWEEGTATHFSILTWRIPRTEEPGGLQFMRSQSPTRLSDRAHTRASRQGWGRGCRVSFQWCSLGRASSGADGGDRP